MTKPYKLTNNILGWILGILASVVYIMTAEPTVSWWDCGEYTATTFKFLVGHPPGAPTFQLIGNIFSLFAGGDVTKVAFCMNCMSAICSGMTIMFLFWTITLLGKKLVKKLGEMTPVRIIAIFGSGLVGALAYTFSDTFWFSAVESEVYAMSSFFTALVFWCILKWDEEYENPMDNVNPNRWLVLIFYLVGLSIGVHLLNLLTIPAIVLVVYFKMSKNASVWGVVLTIGIISFFAAFFFSGLVTFFIWLFITVPCIYFAFKKRAFQSKADWGIFISLIGSFVLLAVILYGIIPGVVNLAGKFEIFFVNKIHLPFNSGTIIFFLLLFGLIGWGLAYGHKKEKRALSIGIYSFIFLLIGYSTFITLVIRSNANPTIDENNPEDAVALLAYLNREQYGSNPLIFGESFNSQLVDFKDGNPVYVKDKASKSYIISNDRKGTEYVYRESDLRLFPRMWSREKSQDYINWLKGNTDMSDAKVKKEMKNLEKGKIPTGKQNFAFLRTYQFNYMYLRYFMWNFVGRQNEIQGRGDLDNGNWVSGIPFIDKKLVGKYDNLPNSMERKGHNTYFFLPLILGLIGLIYYSRKDGINSFIVAMLFIMTGLAIAFYLNMYAFQPRERDYAFAASFYAFSIWIGFGVFAIISIFDNWKKKKMQMATAILTVLICLGLVPGIMAKENWDDHDRSNRYTALAIAKNYLDSCAPNAIIFTLGDNDTFPLWYAQEVEGYRTDVRVCNLSLLNTSWYIDQMKRQAYNSDPLPISMTWDQYKDGSREQLVFNTAGNQFIDLKTTVEYIKQPKFDNKRFLVFMPDGYRSDGANIPGSFSIPVDKEKVLRNGTVSPKDSALIVDKIQWNLRGGKTNDVLKAYLVMMDILANNNWERPIYFAATTGAEGYFGLEEYFQFEGLAYRLVPIKANPTRGTTGRINSDVLYDRLMTFKDHSRIDIINNPNAPAKAASPYLWGGINDPSVFNCEDNIRLYSLVRQLHQRLADQLIIEGNVKKAEEILDLGNEILDPKINPYLMMAQVYYSYACTYYIESYFNLKTETGNQKGIAMAKEMIKEIKETFDWYATCDEKTIEIQKENINYCIMILSQIQNSVPQQFMNQIKPDFESIKIEKACKKSVISLSNTIDVYLRDLQNTQQEIYETFHQIKQLGDFAMITGEKDFANFAYQEIEKHLASIKQVSPQIEAMFRQYLFPETLPVETEAIN